MSGCSGGCEHPPRLPSGTDGVAAARRIRQMPAPHGRVPIIALPADAMTGDRDRCLAAGLDYYISRPIDTAKDRRADGAFATAGQGAIDWPHYRAALRRAGFEGALVTHGLDAAEAPEVARFLSRQAR